MLLGAALKACSLLVAADMTAVLGEAPVKTRASKPQPSASQCLYSLPKTATSVSIEVTRGVQAQQRLDRLRQAAQVEGEEADENERPAIEPIRGLGEEAFFAIGLGMAGVYVAHGKTLLRVSIESSDPNRSNLNNLRRLARRALSHLPR